MAGIEATMSMKFLAMILTSGILISFRFSKQMKAKEKRVKLYEESQ